MNKRPQRPDPPVIFIKETDCCPFCTAPWWLKDFTTTTQYYCGLRLVNVEGGVVTEGVCEEYNPPSDNRGRLIKKVRADLNDPDKTLGGKKAGWLTARPNNRDEECP